MLSYTGARFEIPIVEQNKTFVVAETTALTVTFSINTSRCDQSSRPLTDINFITVERFPTNMSSLDEPIRVCQFPHENGSCVDIDTERGCFCPTDPSAPYQFVTTVDWSFSGTWKWSSQPDLVQAKNIDFVIKCKFLCIRCHIRVH